MSILKPYVRKPPPTTWYLGHQRYLLYMAQELTCIFIGAYALVLLWGLGALANGEQSWLAFLDSLGNPLLLGFQWLTLGVAVYHTVTWLAVTPKAMPLQIGEEFVPGDFILAAQYLAWAGVSIFILHLAGVF